MHIKTKVELQHIDNDDKDKLVKSGAFELVPVKKGRKVLVHLYQDGGYSTSAEVHQPTIKKLKRKTEDVYSDFVAHYETHELKWGDRTLELGPTGAVAAEKILKFLGMLAEED